MDAKIVPHYADKLGFGTCLLKLAKPQECVNNQKHMIDVAKLGEMQREKKASR